MAFARVCADGEPLPCVAGDAGGESGARNDVVADDLHDALQRAASDERASFWRALQGDSGRSGGTAIFRDAAGLFTPESSEGGTRTTGGARTARIPLEQSAGLCAEAGAGWLADGGAGLERADTVRDRRGMLEDLERRMREEAAERCGQVEVPGHESLQSTLQRGWYFGREAFRDWLLEKAGTLLERHRAGGQNYHGPEVADHGKARAKAIIEEGLRKLKLDRDGLTSLRKSDPRKVRLAKAVRKECAVPLKWLAAELQMGSAMNVSRLTNRPISELRNGACGEGRAAPRW